MSTEKHRLLCRQRLFALNHKFCRSLKFRTGRKKWLPSCKHAAMKFGITLNPHSMREMKETSHNSWSGCKWKSISLNPLQHVGEEWVVDDHLD